MARHDEFDDPEGFFSRLITGSAKQAGGLFAHRAVVVSAGIFVGVVALSSVIWASYPSQNPMIQAGGVPVIRADADPYKYVPSDRGGMFIAHQDSTIFDAMRGSGGEQRVENLLGDDQETPVDRNQLFAGLKTELSSGTSATDALSSSGTQSRTQVARMDDYERQRPMTESERRAEAARHNKESLKEEATPLPGTLPTEGSSVTDVIKNKRSKKLVGDDMAPDEAGEEDAVAASSASSALSDSKEGQDNAPDTKKKTEKKASKEEQKTPKNTKKEDVQKSADPAPSEAATAASGSSYVQVASVDNPATAASEWKKLSAKLPDLAGKPYRVVQAVVKGKTYHRVQVGPMSKDAATALCTSIKAKKPGGCLVVK
jgi:hypothetical protein